MVQNDFSVKKILGGQKNLQRQYFVSKEFQGEGTFSVPKKYWLHKIFSCKIFLSTKKFSSMKKFLGKKNWGKKNFGSKNFWVIKIFGIKKMLDPKFFHLKKKQVGLTQGGGYMTPHPPRK